MSEKPTVESLASEMQQLRERVEDLEDLLELRAAAQRNGDKQGTDWNTVKSELLGD